MPVLRSCAWLLSAGFICLNTTSPAGIALQTGHNITGATYGPDSNALPPDAGLAVGPRNVVECVNGRFSVFTKTNFTMSRVKTETDTAFWTAAGVSYSGYISDPRI